jgi:hypothetical protein
MRIEFTRAPGGGYGYGLSVAGDDGSWRVITARDNPLVRGSTFDLLPDEIEQVNDTTVALRGRRGSVYGYSAAVIADARHKWFRFEIDIDAPRAFPLAMRDGYEPEVMLDLGPLPPYERGDHVWFMTNVANPTTWNDDAHGNDMPATYLFDAYKRAELMMFFDMTAMSWTSHANTGRFLNYRCGYKRRYQPHPAGSLGLYLDGFCGKTFPAGRNRFAYYVSAAPRAETPTDQEAVQWLVERCLPLLPPRSEWPARATSWRDVAQKCAQDLMTDHVWHTRADLGGEYMLNYVDARSPAWKEAIEARGNTFDMDQPCLESAVWAAHPLAVLSRIDHEPLYAQLLNRCSKFIARMVAADRTPLAAAKDDAPRGTWQHVYIVEQMFQVARFARDEALLKRIRAEIDAVIVPLARRMQYFFPLSFGKTSLVKRGSGDAHSVLGIYASLMLDLHEWTGVHEYLEEAKRAVRVHHQLPVNTVHQEIFMLAMGAHAAVRLAAIAGEAEFAPICRYLVAQTLRMLHWFDDRTTVDAQKAHTLGMFQACATISYPAIFENVETLARLAATLKLLPSDESLLRVFDHARRNNFYFLPHVLGCHDELPLRHVPLENIGILEGPPPTSVGAEVYGAGWVFRAALLWESFGRCADREIMVLNCDAFDERRQLERGRWDLTFFAFNSGEDARDAELIFPFAVERAATISSDGAPPHERVNGRWKTRLEPGQSRRINVVIDS